MRPSQPASLLVLRVVVLLLAVVFAFSLLPGVRAGGPRCIPVLDLWTNNLFVVGAIVLIADRARRLAQDRAAWAGLAVALTAYLSGNLGYYLHNMRLDEIPYPSWSDAGWTAFYPLAHVPLFPMLRTRVPRLSPSLWLGGVVTGLTAAAFAVAFAVGTALQATEGS